MIVAIFPFTTSAVDDQHSSAESFSAHISRGENGSTHGSFRINGHNAGSEGRCCAFSAFPSTHSIQYSTFAPPSSTPYQQCRALPPRNRILSIAPASTVHRWGPHVLCHVLMLSESLTATITLTVTQQQNRTCNHDCARGKAHRTAAAAHRRLRASLWAPPAARPPTAPRQRPPTSAALGWYLRGRICGERPLIAHR